MDSVEVQAWAQDQAWARVKARVLGRASQLVDSQLLLLQICRKYTSCSHHELKLSRLSDSQLVGTQKLRTMPTPSSLERHQLPLLGNH